MMHLKFLAQDLVHGHLSIQGSHCGDFSELVGSRAPQPGCHAKVPKPKRVFKGGTRRKDPDFKRRKKRKAVGSTMGARCRTKTFDCDFNLNP